MSFDTPTIADKISTTLKYMSANGDHNVPIIATLAILQDPDTSNEELLKVMVDNNLIADIRQELIWHVGKYYLNKIDAKCLNKLRDEKFNFSDALHAAINRSDEDGIFKHAISDASIQINESKYSEQHKIPIGGVQVLPKTSAHATPPKTSAHATPPKISTEAQAPPDDEKQKWKAVVGTKKSTASTKRLVAEHTVGTRTIITKGVGASSTWIRPNDKPENGLDYKYIASAGYVLFPSRPPRIQNADMFSWVAVEKVAIGDNEVLVPWRKGYERNSGWEFIQSEETDEEYIGWYKVNDEFKYTHFLCSDGTWEHYYIDEIKRKNVIISDEEMYKVVSRNLWKNDRE